VLESRRDEPLVPQLQLAGFRPRAPDGEIRITFDATEEATVLRFVAAEIDPDTVAIRTAARLAGRNGARLEIDAASIRLVFKRSPAR